MYIHKYIPELFQAMPWRNHMEFGLTIYMMSSTKITETEFHSRPWQGVCDKFVGDFWQIHWNWNNIDSNVIHLIAITMKRRLLSRSL
jgi:hypothetical protein